MAMHAHIGRGHSGGSGHGRIPLGKAAQGRSLAILWAQGDVPEDVGLGHRT